MSRRNEVVVITGASAGIGRATVQRFARAGARIGLLARGRDRLDATRREVEQTGGTALAIPTDVADAAQVDSAAEQIEKVLGPIDIWINSAMVSVFARVDDITPAEFLRVTQVTYLGQVYGTLAALRRMRPRNRGTIVLVGSALAYRGIPLQAAYCAAKHAVQGFADSLRTELLHDGSAICLTMLQLAAFNTPQFEWVRAKLPRKPRPMGAPYQPEVAADAIYWAAHHHRRELYVGFPALKAIVGNKLAPGYGDRVLAQNGFAGQQRNEPMPPHRPDNLYEPAPGDYSAHGAFDEEARSSSPQFWVTTHRGRIAGAAALGGLLAAAVLRHRRAA